MSPHDTVSDNTRGIRKQIAVFLKNVGKSHQEERRRKRVRGGQEQMSRIWSGHRFNILLQSSRVLVVCDLNRQTD